MTTEANTSPAADGPDRVCRTLAAVLGVDVHALSDDSSPKDIPSWDSLNHLNVVLAIESEFGVSLSLEEALQMRNVAAIRRLLNSRGLSV